MIAGIRGTIAAFEDSAVIVDVHDIQFRILSSASTLSDLGPVGGVAELRTYLLVREDALTLYGFATEQERQLFELLLSVSGVGPRVALNMLSFADPASLYNMIANEDVALLSKIPGIGKVTAGRIILDLKRKLPEDFTIATMRPDDRDREAVVALESLGYSASEARSSLASVENRAGLTVEERVFAALQRLDRS